MAIENENADAVTGITKFIQQNPVLIRGLITAVASVLALILGRTVIDNDTVTLVIDSLVAVSALVQAMWARGKVIAENKVIAWNPDPALNEDIVAGLATVSDVSERWDELKRAASESKSQKQVRAEQAA